ncbi:MAG: hypothetical protein K8R13_08810 [Methanococcoides sp.]|nr:hypothetical protein [Methanococcoides sp.]
MNKGILFGIGAILLALVIFGTPDTLDLGFFTWDLNQDEKNEELYNTNETSEILVSDLFYINNLESRQDIYKINEQATIDFDVQNKLNKPHPYTITVNWIHNNKEYYGWMNESNDSNDFHSYYTVTSQGVWEAQVVLKWEYLNETYSKDEITSLRVI